MAQAIKKEFPSTLTMELKGCFQSLVCSLSPENLSCDGELSNSRIRVRYNKLQREWKQLEKQACCTVTEEDAWSFNQR